MSKHRFHASGDVPFSWESKPGMSKVAPSTEELPKGSAVGKLPPPPCPRERPTVSGHGMYVPLPPCPFQGPRMNSLHSHRSGWEKDPFLAAYMECTRSGGDRGKAAPKQKKKSSGIGWSREVFGLSCKNGCQVVEDGVVRMSRQPQPRLREWNMVGKLRENGHRSLIHEWSRFG